MRVGRLAKEPPQGCAREWGWTLFKPGKSEVILAIGVPRQAER